MLWLLSTVAQGAVLPNAGPKYSQKIPGDNDGYYDDEDYLVNRVLGAAVIGIVIALISCGCGFCFCFAQACAKCCNCAKKCCVCCGADDAPPEGYTQNQRLVLVGILFFGWAMIVAGSALGYSGNAQVADKLTDFADLSKLISNQIYDQVKLGYDAADLVGTNPDEQMVTDAEKLKKDVNDGADALKDSNDLRILVVYIFYAVMMAVPLLGFVSWACGISCPAYVMTQISFCMLFLAWVFFGITFASGVILDDTCVNAAKHVYGEPNALADLLKCGETGSGQSSYDSVWQELDTLQSRYTTEGYTPAFPTEMSVGFTTNTYGNTSARTNAKYYSRNRALLIEEYIDFGVDEASCASITNGVATATTELCYVPNIDQTKYQNECISGSAQALSIECLQQGIILSTAGMTGASYLISCEHLNVLALDLNNNICDDMVDGLINVCVGQAFIGFFYFFVVAVGCMGMNRFKKENYSDSPARVHPQDIEAQPPGVQAHAMPKQDDATPGEYSAEQAMAATKIQNVQRQKVARKRVANKRAESAQAQNNIQYQ